ncbi:MAG: tRNA lysidine(34) synthetase TilS [Lachnospiraceae bacterium]|nr:tRNA lysidine(34) synthetase TilS [Lachnospiraceae bacterium]
METSALKKVKEQMLRRGTLAQGMSVIVGFSGGSDSLCLLLLLREITQELGIPLAAVHVNHGIRGEAAARDEAFCREFCGKRDIPLFVEARDVPAIAAETGTGIEEAGRTVRYRIFEEIAGRFGANRVAVAHHADDRAETVLWNLIRGSGLRGLTGISSESMPFADPELVLIRPLLSVRKADILAELAARGQDFCVDETNYGEEGARNFLRNRVMPLLAECNPGAQRNIAGAGERLEAVRRYMDSLADEACGRLIHDRRLDAAGFSELPEALRPEVALRYLAEVCGRRQDLTYVHTAALERLCEGAVSAELSLPYGVTLVREYREIAVKETPLDRFAGRHEVARRELERGVRLRFAGEPEKVLSFSVRKREECEIFPKNSCTKWFDYDKIGKACVVRTRRPGDRIVITSDGRTQSVQDLLVNRKVPKAERDGIPLVLTWDEGTVVWVPGVRGSETFRMDENTRMVLEIHFTEDGQSEAQEDGGTYGA